MKYLVKIKQTLTGYCYITANSLEHVYKIAEIKYIRNGERLPEMEDVDELRFEIDEDNKQ